MDKCVACDEPYRKPCILQIGALLVCVIVIIAFVARKYRDNRDKFVSERAQKVFDSAKPLFEATQGRPSYSEYKTKVPGADPVQYSDLKSLWTKGSFTPETVQTAL